MPHFIYLAIQCETCEEYKACGSPNPLTCKNRCGTQPTLPVKCVEGCFCPNGTVKHNGDCIKPEKCPCYVGKQVYEEGQSITKTEGKCTQKW